jgi:hypothetical protein
VPLGTDKRDICNRNSFDFGERLRFDAATVTKIKISPGTPTMPICSAKQSAKLKRRSWKRKRWRFEQRPSLNSCGKYDIQKRFDGCH